MKSLSVDAPGLIARSLGALSRSPHDAVSPVIAPTTVRKCAHNVPGNPARTFGVAAAKV